MAGSAGSGSTNEQEEDMEGQKEKVIDIDNDELDQHADGKADAKNNTLVNTWTIENDKQEESPSKQSKPKNDSPIPTDPEKEDEEAQAIVRHSNRLSPHQRKNTSEKPQALQEIDEEKEVATQKLQMIQSPKQNMPEEQKRKELPPQQAHQKPEPHPSYRIQKIMKADE